MSHPVDIATGERAAGTSARRKGMRGSPGLTLLAAALGVMMVALDGTIVAVANPAIQTNLGASLADIQWVTNGYLLALAVTLITVGKIGDRFGHRKVFLTGIVGFGLTSAAIGLSGDIAKSITLMIAFRVLQGVFGAMLQPTALALLRNTFPVEKLNSAIGIWGGVLGASTAAGPIVGGLLVQHINWEACFYVNVPVGIIALAVGMLVLRETPSSSAGPLVRRPWHRPADRVPVPARLGPHQGPGQRLGQRPHHRLLRRGGRGAQRLHRPRVEGEGAAAAAEAVPLGAAVRGYLPRAHPDVRDVRRDVLHDVLHGERARARPDRDRRPAAADDRHDDRRRAARRAGDHQDRPARPMVVGMLLAAVALFGLSRISMTSGLNDTIIWFALLGLGLSPVMVGATEVIVGNAAVELAASPAACSPPPCRSAARSAPPCSARSCPPR